jgi:3-oxoacyl-[acyl-carrier protein] reductase
MKVLVVGASGEIGRQVALSFPVDTVTGTWHSQVPPDLAAIHMVQCDLTSTLGVSLLVDRTRPDILINCAGIQANARVQNLDPDDWDRVVAINLTAPFFLTKFALPDMIEAGWGRIIHLSSMASHLPLIGASAYTATKAGLEGFVRTAAADVATKGVTINCVAPGALDVGMGAGLSEKARDAFLARIPSRRFGTAQDVVRAIHFLIDSPYVTGQSIRVDGGMW